MVRLLARGWQPGSRTLIKPTHVALNVAPAPLAATPQARAVLLHSTLQDFIVSNLKKNPETKDKVGQLATRLLADAGAPSELLQRAGEAAGWAGLVAAQWLATKRLAQALMAAAPGRVIALTDRELLADVPGRVVELARQLGLPAQPEALAKHAAAESGRHAKATEVVYDAGLHEREAALILGRFGSMIADALDFAGAVAPALLGDGPLRAAVR